MGDIHRWWRSDGRPEGGFLRLPAGAGGDDDRHRIRIICALQLHCLANAFYRTGYIVQSAPLRRSLVDCRLVPGGWNSGLAVLEPSRSASAIALSHKEREAQAR